jgi:hypothetical protein
MADPLSAALAQGDTNWNAYFLSEAQALEDSWGRAIGAYRQMRSVSEILGVPYMSQPDLNAPKGLPTVWTPDLEQGLVDLMAMKELAVNALKDVAAGKRTVGFNKEGTDWAIQALPTDPVVLITDSEGRPVLCKAGTDPCEAAHGSGTLGIIQWEIIAVVGAALLVWGSGIWTLKAAVDKVPDVAARVAEVKVNQTWSECQQAAIAKGDTKAQQQCTTGASAVGTARVATFDAEAGKITAKECADTGGSYSPATKICTPGETPTEKLVRTLLWGAAGLGIIYTVVKLGPGLLEETKARRQSKTLHA